MEVTQRKIIQMEGTTMKQRSGRERLEGATY
jgi:hypothetical protein